MNAARHHAEWLSLVETSGPFLSMPVLLRVFPQALEARDPAKASELREAYEDWLESGKKFSVHHAWVRHVIERLLGYTPDYLAEGQAIPPGMEAIMSNFGETLRPDFVLKHRDAGEKPVLLIDQYPREQDLEKPVAGKLWKASPGTRMMELLHATNVPLGLVTNGEQWMVVYAPRGETTGFASWYADLWMQEPITLRAFHSLLHLGRFLGVAEPDTLAGLYAASSKDQQEVTDQLGYQVRQAVEMLVQAFDRIDAESGRKLLADVSEKTLYDSALTVMMRLVFLFSADERGLLLLGDPLYDQHYAVSTLSEILRERADQHGEEILEHRQDAWCRLLATFRAVHGGVEHEAMRLPPYGGTLFDPDRYPFLEGRPAESRWQTTPATPLAINNRVVLHLLEALQLLRVKVPGGGPTEARRLSFRALDIEQIGHVYEGLLDHTAKRAGETILGLTGSKNSDAEIPLSKLEEVAQKDTAAQVEFLHEETGRSKPTLKRLIEEPPPHDEHALLIACGQDSSLANRVKPFAGLLRGDSFAKLVVISEGSVYVTAGSDRRSTGTHYTPRSLTEPIVQHTLEPLVYVGPAEGQSKEQWLLKCPKDILALKVCDMAMGSGAFLVQTCRYLGERLVEAWENAEKANPGQFIATPEGELSGGDPSERLIPADPAERLAIARRYVADRCLYGVDINPMAVEMAKLSLWLITLQRDRPFTFLDHALKCGDSLLGVSSVQQSENFSLRPGDRQVTFATANLFRYVEEASAKRRALEDLPSNDHTQIETKTRLHAEADAATAKVKALADCLIAFELRGLDGSAYEDQRTEEAEKVQLLIKRDGDASLDSHPPTTNQLSAYARKRLNGRRTFHWPVEFPEVFARGGFDAFVGNPPFLGGKRISGVYGDDYRSFIVRAVANGAIGSADYSAYFYLRARACLGAGCFGLIATNTIAQGDTKDVGLGQLLKDGTQIYRAVASQKWPGSASQDIAIVWATSASWSGPITLDGRGASAIGADLRELGSITGVAQRLQQNAKKAFQGSLVNGTGFILEADEALRLIETDKRNREVIQPYLIGDDINTSPMQQARRWIINFRDWSREKASSFEECFDIVTARVKPHRDPIVAKGKQVHEYDYWKFWDKRLESYSRVNALKRAIVTSLAAKHVIFAFADTGVVFVHRLGVVIDDRAETLALLQSTFHSEWAWKYSATIGGAGIGYSLTDAFETFPFPRDLAPLKSIAERYDELRRQIMLSRQEGLTKTYNRFHDRRDKSEEIARLRALHEELDQAVAAAYGWSDLDLGHGFHPTKQGERYTLSEPTRRTVLDRLLALNHQLYAEELKAGFHEKAGKKVKKTKGDFPGGARCQPDLIAPPQADLFD